MGSEGYKVFGLRFVSGEIFGDDSVGVDGSTLPTRKDDNVILVCGGGCLYSFFFSGSSFFVDKGGGGIFIGFPVNDHLDFSTLRESGVGKDSVYLGRCFIFLHLEGKGVGGGFITSFVSYS